MNEELCFMPATELVARIRRRDLSPVEVVEAFLERIGSRNDEINAYVTVTGEQAREEARSAERTVMSGTSLGLLHGLPVAIKDADSKAGVRCTFGSKPLADYVPKKDATVVQRLEEAGAIVLGKTNLCEFGQRATTDNLLFGPTSTPFAPGRNAGGSSGGSAAAVADGLCAIAQGSDGGGSIRIPASLCGVYGFKATYGRVAAVMRPNAFSTHTPFIHTGPLTRTVEDAALMLNVMAGPHSRDPLCMSNDEIDFTAAVHRPISGLKVAYSPDFGGFPVDLRVGVVVEEAVRVFESVGAHVDEVEVNFKRNHRELTELWFRMVRVLLAQQFAALQDNEGIDLIGLHRAEIASELVEMVEAARGYGAVEYKRDDEARTEIFDAVQDVLDEYDLLVTPTVAVPPFPNADDGNTVGPSEINGERVNPLLGWVLTHPINMSGHPAVSVPAGFTEDGLPIGMQLIGHRFAEETLFAASAAFERVKPWHSNYPPR